MSLFNAVTLSDKQVAFIAERSGVMTIYPGATVFG